MDVYLYDNFDGTSPTNLLFSRENLAFGEVGYHSVSVSPPLALTSGNDVIVVVKFTNESYFYPIPCDDRGPHQTGRCYASGTGEAGSWTDVGSEFSEDVGIRVRTSDSAVAPTPTSTGTPTRTPTPTPTRSATPGASPTATATLPAHTARVHGTLRLDGRSNHSGAVVSIAGRDALSAVDGTYWIDGVCTGVWSAAASCPGYLPALRSSVVVLSGQDVYLPDLTLRSGDASADCSVDLFDLVIVAVAYNPRGPVSDARADLNADAVVDLFDIVLVSANYSQSCPQTW